MTAHPNPRQAFRQFQYLTVPLSVSGDYKNKVMRLALARAFEEEDQ